MTRVTGRLRTLCQSTGLDGLRELCTEEEEMRIEPRVSK